MILLLAQNRLSNNSKMNLALKNKYPIIYFLISQAFGLIILKLIAMNGLHLHGPIALTVHIIVSTFLSQFIFRLPKWFFYISVIFPILLFVSFNYIHLAQAYYGILFIFIVLTFSHVIFDRVPLYLTNETTTDAILEVIKEYKLTKFVDLGSGTGKVVRSVAKFNVDSFGAESAPFVFIYSSLISFANSIFNLKGGKILNKNIWKIDLCEYDCVYTFLSPAVMDKIGNKFSHEMKKGSVLISNSFCITGIRPTKIINLNDQRKTKLFIYVKN